MIPDSLYVYLSHIYIYVDTLCLMPVVFKIVTLIPLEIIAAAMSKFYTLILCVVKQSDTEEAYR